ncbi:hypothetical protein [Lyngbya confervoides]|uniref:Uncharacterized protein n=1 Tax=Lyngbya confervoides BDU141951 TaxID=1574623 RepID=A0ABD4T1A7_9CYAN|nr:hypothetical protein [Lyngbya confervoides]MCM1982150.1 hypothetical protein [Lyngbya confervoides BDU141951]
MQLYIGLGILAALTAIGGLIAANLKHQRDMELARVKEAECKRSLLQVPDLSPWPEGNKLPSEEILRLKPGRFVAAYGYQFPGERWPGPFFEELSETGGVDKFSISLKISSISDGLVTGTSACFPGNVRVPFDYVYDDVISPLES